MKKLLVSAQVFILVLAVISIVSFATTFDYTVRERIIYDESGLRGVTVDGFSEGERLFTCGPGKYNLGYKTVGGGVIPGLDKKIVSLVSVPKGEGITPVLRSDLPRIYEYGVDTYVLLPGYPYPTYTRALDSYTYEVLYVYEKNPARFIREEPKNMCPANW